MSFAVLCYLVLSGLSLDFPWIKLGSSLDYPRIIPGLGHDSALILPWLSLNYPWIIRILSLDHPWIISGLSLTLLGFADYLFQVSKQERASFCYLKLFFFLQPTGSIEELALLKIKLRLALLKWIFVWDQIEILSIDSFLMAHWDTRTQGRLDTGALGPWDTKTHGPSDNGTSRYQDNGTLGQ